MIKQFTEFELFQMFGVECAPNADRKESSRCKTIEGPYVIDDIKVPLWANRKRELPRGEKVALQQDDNIKESVSSNPPGSRGRVEDLARFYADNMESEKSAFYA